MIILLLILAALSIIGFIFKQIIKLIIILAIIVVAIYAFLHIAVLGTVAAVFAGKLFCMQKYF